MDWNKQIEILNKLTSEFNKDYASFISFTKIDEFISKLGELNKLNKNATVIYGTEYTFYQNNVEQSEIQSNPQTHDEINIFKDINVKRKHLLRKIHPDKIDNLINSYKKDMGINIDIDFNAEKEKILLCATKIISEKLNVIDSFVLLSNKTLLFDHICFSIGIDNKHIEKIKLLSKQIDLKKKIIDDSYFSSDLIKFMDTFRELKKINSLHHVIQSNLMEIYSGIKKFIEKNFLSVVNDKITILQNLKNSKIFLKHDENNEFLEQIQMFMEENREYLIIWISKYEYTLLNCIEFFKDKNEKFYNLVTDIKTYLPIFYNLVMSVKIKGITPSYYVLPHSFELNELDDVVNSEYTRVKLMI
jgi:hypothetical protein